VSLSTTVVTRSLRPVLRPSDTGVRVAAVTGASDTARYQAWLRDFRVRAMAAGVAPQTLDWAFHDVTPDPEVIRRDRRQAEFSKPIWEYLDSAVSRARLANGRAALDTHARTLAAIERRYGVEKEVVVAIWGLESAYGSYTGNMDVIRSLSTLAFDGRRGAFFEEQLLAALKIIENGDTAPRNMTGSWAGAMGHTQFIPTSYLAHAVDFTGDGKRDIWSDDPTDALASTAAYLSRHGWVTGHPWAVEVRLPDGFDYRLADREIKKYASAWATLGIRVAEGARVSDNFGPASILLPAGRKGVALMIFRNFNVIERYNTADAYVIGVGHLSDRLAGGAPFRESWPRGEKQLTVQQKKTVQRKLTRRGFDTQGVDGRVGPNTMRAVRAFQVAYGLPADGYPDWDLLQRLR
jgi:lytic murein transglycosylase